MLRDLINKRIRVFQEVICDCKTKGAKSYYLKEYKRWLCRNDLFFLTCITGHEKIAEWGSFYKPFCDEVSLMNWKVTELNIHAPSEMMLPHPGFDLAMQRLYLRYRGYYKTTIVTICHTAQLLLNFNNIHVVLCQHQQPRHYLPVFANLYDYAKKTSQHSPILYREEYTQETNPV